MMNVMVIYSNDVLGEVLKNRITNYLMAYFRKMTLVFLPSCDNIPIAQNKMRNCRRKYDFHYVTGFRCSCGSCTEASWMKSSLCDMAIKLVDESNECSRVELSRIVKINIILITLIHINLKILEVTWKTPS